MKKGVIKIVSAVIFVMVVMFGSSLISAQTTTSGEVKDVFEIKDSLFVKHTKTPVIFNHKKHSKDYKIECADCHHVYKDSKNVWKDGDAVQKCSECHTSAKKDEGQMLSLYKAYHNNCKGCHKDIQKGPRKCDECHPKK